MCGSCKLHRRAVLGLAGAIMASPLVAWADEEEEGGCWFSDAGGSGGLGALSSESGNGVVDAFCARERDTLNRQFGVVPALFFSTNSTRGAAMASKRQRDESCPDGSVYISTPYLDQMRAEFPKSWQLVVASILAHEWGHILQFKAGEKYDWMVEKELKADELSGWYLAATRGLDTLDAAKGDLERMFVSAGNLGFKDFEFHGTPSQRRVSFMKNAGIGDWHGALGVSDAAKRVDAMRVLRGQSTGESGWHYD